MVWSVYIVKCSDNSYYTGITNNLGERITEHNNGKGAKYTKMRRPVRLVYNRKFLNQSQARKEEIKIKDFSRIKKERLIEEMKEEGFPPA